jgi:hypothetical protein
MYFESEEEARSMANVRDSQGRIGISSLGGKESFFRNNVST